MRLPDGPLVPISHGQYSLYYIDPLRNSDEMTIDKIRPPFKITFYFESISVLFQKIIVHT